MIETEFMDNYICLENKHEMLNAYLMGGSANGQRSFTGQDFVNLKSKSKSMELLKTNGKSSAQQDVEFMQMIE